MSGGLTVLQRQRSRGVAGNILNAMKTEVLKEEILMVCTIKMAVPCPVNATFAKKIVNPDEDCYLKNTGIFRSGGKHESLVFSL